MNKDSQDPSLLYRQFRALSDTERDTSDAVQRFAGNRVVPSEYESQIDHIIQSLPVTSVRSHSTERKRENWYDRLFQAFSVKPALVVAVATGLLLTVSYLRPYSWDEHIPQSLVSDSLIDSIGDTIGGSAQLGFVSRANEQGAGYHLGKISVQLALCMSVDNQTLLPYFAATLEHIAESAPAASYSGEVLQIATLLSGQPSDRAVGKAITDLKLQLDVSAMQRDSFVLGQRIETLRLALIDADNSRELPVLRQAGLAVSSFDTTSVVSQEISPLLTTLEKIQELAGGTYSLDERRLLMQYIQQLDVLLT